MLLPSVATLEPLVAQVYKSLLNAISHAELRPGQKIPQADIANSLGVSRQPVSHALHLLRQQGLIEISGRKGLAVAAVQVDRVRELYQIRGQLDALAARLAGERVKAGLVTAAELDVLDRIVAAATDLDSNASIAAILDAELAFHRHIYQLSGNQSIEPTLAGHWPHLMRAMALIHSRRPNRHQAGVEHCGIADAIRLGDGASAARLAQDHADRAREEIGRHLEEARP